MKLGRLYFLVFFLVYDLKTFDNSVYNKITKGGCKGENLSSLVELLQYG